MTKVALATKSENADSCRGTIGFATSRGQLLSGTSKETDQDAILNWQLGAAL